jgi:hypothetical protein
MNFLSNYYPLFVAGSIALGIYYFRRRLNLCSKYEGPIPTWENLLNDDDFQMCEKYLESKMTKNDRSYSIYKHFVIPANIQEDVDVMNKLDNVYETIVKKILRKRGISFSTLECFPCRIMTE